MKLYMCIYAKIFICINMLIEQSSPKMTLVFYVTHTCVKSHAKTQGLLLQTSNHSQARKYSFFKAIVFPVNFNSLFCNSKAVIMFYSDIL